MISALDYLFHSDFVFNDVPLKVITICYCSEHCERLGFDTPFKRSNWIICSGKTLSSSFPQQTLHLIVKML
jgi:hypothetical protein